MTEKTMKSNLYGDLVSLLSKGYPYSDISDKLHKILSEVGPTIASITIKEASKGAFESLRELWEKVKKGKEIQEKLRDTLKKVDRIAIVYFASKFENNEYVGTSTMRVALKAELLRLKGRSELTEEDKKAIRVIESIFKGG